MTAAAAIVTSGPGRAPPCGPANPRPAGMSRHDRDRTANQRLLRAYPGWYRNERGDGMLDTLMAAAPSGQWPSLRDSGPDHRRDPGPRQPDQRLGTRANLRLAALLGVTLSLIWLMVNGLTGTIQLWAHTTGFVLGGTTLTQFVLTVAAVAAVWFTPWWVTTALALAAAGSWLAWDTHLVLALHP